MSAVQQLGQVAPSVAQGSPVEGGSLREKLVRELAASGSADELVEVIRRLPADRESATLLVKALEEKSFGEKKDSDGMPVRFAAVEALIEMGFPYALEVPPEELEALREFEARRRGRAPLVIYAFLWAVAATLFASTSSVAPYALAAGAVGFTAAAVGPENPRALGAARLLIGGFSIVAALGLLLPQRVDSFSALWVLTLLSLGGLLELQRRARKVAKRRMRK